MKFWFASLCLTICLTACTNGGPGTPLLEEGASDLLPTRSTTTQTIPLDSFFDEVGGGLEFFGTEPDVYVVPLLRSVDLVQTRFIEEPNSEYPLIEYRFSCGGQDRFGDDYFASVFTFAASTPEEQISQRADDFRNSGFNPGGIAETSSFSDGEEEFQYAYTDHVRGVDPNDPNVTSYQYTTAGITSFSTGAWVTTSFMTEGGVDIEVVVAAFEGYDTLNYWEGNEVLIEPEAPTRDELMDTPNDPTLAWRFDCVADTWALIEPVIDQYRTDQ